MQSIGITRRPLSRTRKYLNGVLPPPNLKDGGYFNFENFESLGEDFFSSYGGKYNGNERVGGRE